MMDQELASVEYEITRGDLVMMRLWSTWRVPALRYLFLAPVAVASAFSLVVMPPLFSVPRSVVFLVFAVLLLLAWQLLKLALRSMQKGESVGRCRLALVIDGIRVRADVDSDFHPWRAVTDIIETRSFIILAFGANHGYVIPRRSFETIESARHFAGVARKARAGRLSAA